jgi:hypothetical protein
VDERFTGVMVTGDPVASYADIKKYWAAIRDKMGPGGRYKVTVHYEPAKLFGDIAVAHGTTDDAVTSTHGEFTFSSHWTAVCVKKSDGACGCTPRWIPSGIRSSRRRSGPRAFRSVSPACWWGS